MTKRIQTILDRMDEKYGTELMCSLEYNEPWQLLIATILSAQCTDARVNMVTKDLFAKYTEVEAIAQANIEELEKDIHSTGFYHNKAKNMIACCQDLMSRFQGEVPQSLEDLTSLAGVGRKTANVIRGNIYREPSIVVDTHVKRISKKLGLTKADDPTKIEMELMKKLPRERWILWNIHLITLGREICKAPTPFCEKCFLQDICPSSKSKRIMDFTVLDIETTGLYPKTDKIIEIGAVKVRNGQITAQMESLVSPGRGLEERITELTGISEDMLRDAPKPEDVIPKLLDFIGGDVLLGHSILFDYSFVKRAAVNLGLSIPAQTLGIDTLKIARNFLPELESRSLPFLCNYYGIPLKAHRALEDAKATATLYQKLANDFWCEKQFTPGPLIYHVKREAPAGEKQKERLYKLVEKHKLIIDYEIDRLTKNEASRLIDKIILKYGRE